MPTSVYPPVIADPCCDPRRIAFERLSFLSHDLRSPLTSVLALVDSLRDGEQSIEQGSEQNKALERGLDLIEQYAERSLHVGDQLMQLLRVENLPHVERVELDCLTLLENVCEQKTPMAKAAGVMLRLPAPEPAVPWISGQAEMLERAFANLIDNAIKYSHRDGTVELLLVVQDEQLHCTVQDQGIGIEESDLAELFCRYGRLRQAPPDKAGAGLGLHLVKTIAVRHDGRIMAESVAGQGSCFTLSLPLATTEG